MEKINQLLATYAEQRRQFTKDATQALREVFKDVFDQHPELTVIVWSQYTPYFNDGDECVFRVNSVTCSNAPDTENVSSWGEYEGEEEGVWLWSDGFSATDVEASASIRKMARALDEVIQSSDMTDVLKDVFGDHVQVTVTRDGIDITDYEHD